MDGAGPGVQSAVQWFLALCSKYSAVLSCFGPLVSLKFESLHNWIAAVFVLAGLTKESCRSLYNYAHNSPSSTHPHGLLVPE